MRFRAYSGKSTFTFLLVFFISLMTIAAIITNLYFVVLFFEVNERASALETGANDLEKIDFNSYSVCKPVIDGLNNIDIPVTKPKLLVLDASLVKSFPGSSLTWISVKSDTSANGDPVIFIDPRDLKMGDSYLEFVIAHELGHLVLKKGGIEHQPVNSFAIEFLATMGKCPTQNQIQAYLTHLQYRKAEIDSAVQDVENSCTSKSRPD